MTLKLLYYLAFSGLFFAVYRALYARLSFHRINRWALLLIPPISLLIAFVAPEFNLGLGQETVFQIQLPEIVIEGNRLQVSESQTPVPSLWRSIYFSGIALSLVYFLSGVWMLIKLHRKAQTEEINGVKVFFSRRIKSAFCFGAWVFIPADQRDNPKLPLIIKHELIHQELGHSFDRLYYKVLTTLLWFDPFIHLLSKEIRQVHEYEVDARILHEEKIENYAHMLLSSTLGSDLSFPEKALSPSPFFNSSLIKSRITMMYKNQSPAWRKALYLAFIPLLSGMLLIACNKSEETQVVEGRRVQEVVSDLSKLDQLPLAVGCEANADKEAIQQCAFQHISRHISENFRYPDLAKEVGLEGRIMVSFVVDENGAIDEVKIAQNILKGQEVKQGEIANEQQPTDERMAIAAEQAEKEAIKLVESIPAFDKGALKDGAPVRVQMMIPIQLKLS